MYVFKRILVPCQCVSGCSGNSNPLSVLSQVKLLEAGDEAGAKERLDSVKAAVDKKGAPKAAPKAAKEGSIPLPAALEQMGCDEALWSKIKQKKPFVTESARACSYNSSRQVQKT